MCGFQGEVMRDFEASILLSLRALGLGEDSHSVNEDLKHPMESSTCCETKASGIDSPAMGERCLEMAPPDPVKSLDDVAPDNILSETL